MNVMPFIAGAGVVLVTFGLWRTFKSSNRLKSGPQNSWQNANFLARQSTGSWAEDALTDGEKTAPEVYSTQDFGR